MIPQLPPYVSLVFGLTTLLTSWLFWRAARHSKLTLLVLLVWLVLQTGPGLTGFYQKTDVFPPHFPALVVPPLLLLIGLWLTRRGRRFIDKLRPDQLTLLHVVRIPVEVVLFWLFVGEPCPH